MWAGQRQRGQHPCCSLMHTETVEDYLKAIFELVTRNGAASTSTLAQRLGVAAPTVSAMLKRLASDDLVARTGVHAVTLTEHGTRHALAVVRRHRLIEEFLVTALDVPWDAVHAEAEILEHAVSDGLLERIDTYLDRPTHDPHGDPIPASSGPHEERWTTPLADVAVGASFRVQRVVDRDADALRCLGELGIRPGVVLQVVEQAPFGGPLWVDIDGHRHALGPALTHVVFGVAS